MSAIGCPCLKVALGRAAPRPCAAWWPSNRRSANHRPIGRRDRRRRRRSARREHSARAESRRRNRIGDDDRTVRARQLQVVAQSRRGHVNAVGDEADRQSLAQAQRTRWMMLSCRCKHHRAAVAEMSEQRQPGVDGGAKFVDAGIAMPGRNKNLPTGEPPGRLESRIALRRECDQPCQAATCVHERFHQVDVAQANVLRRMGADVSGRFVDERPLNVQAPTRPWTPRDPAGGCRRFVAAGPTSWKSPP